MASTAPSRLTDKQIHRLWSNPKMLVRIFVSAVKQKQRMKVADLTLTFGEMFYSAGAPKLALDFCKVYLKTWGQRRDENTGEIRMLAANAAGHLGDPQLSEDHLKKLIKLAAQNQWHSLHRRALQTLGVLRHHQHRLDERDKLYGQALKIALASGDKLGVAQLLNNLGASALDRGSIEEGEQLLRRSIALKRELSFEADAAGTLVTLGGVLARSNRLDEGRATLKEAIRIASRYHDKRVLSLAYCNLGSLSSDAGQPHDAPRLMKIGLRYANQVGDAYGRRLCVQGLAVTYHRLHKYAESIKYFRELIEITKQLQDVHAQALAHHDLGSVLVLGGHRDEAGNQYLEAIKQFGSLGDAKWHSKSILSLAKILTDPKQVSEMLRQILSRTPPTLPTDIPITELTNLSVRWGLPDITKDALEIERSNQSRAERPRWPWRIAGLGAMASRYGHWPVAERLLNESLRLFKKRSSLEIVGKIENDLGIAQLEQSKNEQALQGFRRALKLGRRLSNRDQIAQSSHNIGELYRRTNKYQLAIVFLRKSLEAAEAIEDIESQAGSLHSLGLTYCAAGVHNVALLAFRKVRSIGRRLQSPFHLAQAGMGLGQVAFERGNFDEAFSEFQTAARLFAKLPRSNEQMIAIYEAGLAAMKLGWRQRSAKLLMKSAKMASDNSDWSMLSTALQGFAYLTAEYGTALQTADLIASALMAGAATHNRRAVYSSALKAYSDTSQKLLARRVATTAEFLELILAKLGKGNQSPMVAMIKQHLERASHLDAARRSPIS